MTQLHQLLAVESGAKKGADQALTQAYHAIQRGPQFDGLSREYKPRDEEGEQLPAEYTLPQVKVGDIIKGVTPALERLIDVTATKDLTNTSAKADVKLEDGTVIAADVPAVTLLWLEKQCEHLVTFTSRLPTLNPAKQWAYDSNVGAHRALPEQTIRTKKVMKNHVMSEATEKHPAQVQVYTEDVPVGTWTKVDFSGAIPADEKAEYVARAQQLLDAVKVAREAANTQEVADLKIGAGILGFVFGGE